MNEEIKNRLLEFLDKALNGVDESIAFMGEQLPDYIEQLLTWYMVYGLTLWLVGFLIIYINVKVIKRLNNFFVGKDWGNYPHIIIPYGAIFIVSSFASMALISNLQWLQILIAPKVWLVEYASKLAG